MQINCGGVSKVISSLAEDIEDGSGRTQKQAEEVKEKKFKIQIASAKTTINKSINKIINNKTTKNNSEVSGDTSIQTKLHDGKFMMAISDGMGSRAKSTKKQFNSH